MPYIWEDAAVFLEHGGVTVYHIYKNDLRESGCRTYWYGLTPDCSDGGYEGGEFDVRELTEYGEQAIEQAIRSGIDNGKLSNQEPYLKVKEDE
jgi:hypothetical protein